MRFNVKDISMVEGLRACVLYAEKYHYTISGMYIEPRTGEFRIELAR